MSFLCLLLSLSVKIVAPHFVRAMAGNVELREQATPLISTSQPAGSRQQVMSPTLGWAICHPRHPGGMVTQVHTLRTQPTPAQVHGPGGVGFASDMAAGRASRGARLCYPSQPVVSDRAQSGTDSPSILQEVIQAEVARRLAILDQRATARELEIAEQEPEIQRLRQQIAEANAHREQALRAAALANAQSTARVPAPPRSSVLQLTAKIGASVFKKLQISSILKLAASF